MTQDVQFPILETLSDEERRTLLGGARRRQFARGEVVFREGDPGDSLYLVQSGMLGVEVATPTGERAILNVLGAGHHFGELAVLQGDSGSRRTATVYALNPAELLALSRATFDGLRAARPQVDRLVTAMLAQRVEQLSHRLLETMYLSVDNRVHLRLVELADLVASDSGEGVVIPLSQDALAGVVGAARPTVNRALGDLESRQIIARGHRQIRVLDLEALRARARLS